MDILLKEEKLVVDCLSRYGCLKWEQMEQLLNYKKPEVIQKIFLGLKKRQIILEDEDGYVMIDPRATKDHDVILAFWVLLKFMSQINPNEHYPANYPSQIYFLKNKVEYEIMVVSDGNEHLIRMLFSENRNNSNDEEDMTKYIFVVSSRDSIEQFKEPGIIPQSAIDNKQVLFAVPIASAEDTQDFEFLRF